MDPSEALCRMHDPFSEEPEPQPRNLPWASFAASDFEVAFVSTDGPPAHAFAPPGYSQLQQIKHDFAEASSADFRAARDACNPFERIDNGPYMNRAAIKLANLDAIAGLTPKLFDPLNTSFSLDSSYTFADVAAGPGGFTQYLQRRYPSARGAGITLRSSIDFSHQLLDMERFTAFYGEDDTGDLYRYTNEFQEFVAETLGGVDLLVADGGMDEDDQQEYLSSRLLTCQAYLGVSCVLEGGNFVCKVFDTVNRHTAELIYLVSTCFDKVVLAKPVSSRPANAERYLVCKGRRAQEIVDPAADILYDALDKYKGSSFLESLLAENQLPPAFVEWLEHNNRIACESQTAACDHIARYLSGDKAVVEELPKYSIQKFSIIWNI